MKVALIGNMNNNHFALTRYLRDHGVDAELLLFDNEIEHFHPACDTYTLDFMSYTRRLHWGASTSFRRTRSATVRSDLAGYDVRIGCGLSPAYLAKAKLPLDVFVPYGDDIWSETKYRFVAPHRIPSVWEAVRSQRAAIPRSKVIHLGLTNAIYENQWERYRGASVRWLDGIPMVYSGEYRPENVSFMLERTHWGQEFKIIRSQCDVMIFYHARHWWTGDQRDPNAKGTEKLLKAFAVFLSRNLGVRARLVTIEYGPDVAASKELIADLGIQSSVVWMPKMYRKDIMVGLLLADIVAAEFVHNWLMSGVMYEALVAAKPILAYRDDAPYAADYGDLYKIMNAREVEEIASQMQSYLSDQQPFVAMGQAGRTWYEREVAGKAVDKYLDYVRGRV